MNSHQPPTFSELGEIWDSRFEFNEDDDVAVKIAVLDTGIDEHHKDFQTARASGFHKGQPQPAEGEPSQIDRVAGRKNFCGKDDKDVQDHDGHGTQVAGIILRLAPRAELYIARICDGNFDRTSSIDEELEAHASNITYPLSDIVAKVRVNKIEVRTINLTVCRR